MSVAIPSQDTLLIRRSQRAVALALGLLALSNFRSIPRELSSVGWPPALAGALVAVSIVGCVLVLLNPSDRLPACLIVVLPIVMRRELTGLSNGAYAVGAVLSLWLAATTIAAGSRHARLAGLLWRATNWQVYVIYASACVAKLRVPEWRGGTALRDYGRDPYFGFGPSFHWMLNALAAHPWLDHTATWSILLAEGCLAFAWVIPRQRRWPLVAVAVSLHLGIGIFLGLGDFSLMMLAALAVIAPEWRHRIEPPLGGRAAGGVLDEISVGPANSQ